jgi:hypothetical protein
LKTDFGGLPIAFHLTGGEASDNHRAAIEHRRIYRPGDIIRTSTLPRATG